MNTAAAAVQDSANADGGGRLRIAASRLMCLMAAAMAAMALMGWILDIPILRSVLPGAVQMKVNTALCLALLSIALWIRSGAASTGRLLPCRVLGAMAAAIGFVTLLEYAFQFNAGIDQLFVADTFQRFNPSPGRMSPFSAGAFVLLGSAFAVPLSQPWRPWFVLACLLSFAVGCLSLLGYVMDARELITDDWAPPVAANTAVALTLLSISSLLVDPFVFDFWRSSQNIGSVRGKLFVGFGFALVILTASGAHTYRMQLRTTHSNERQSRAAEVRHALQSLYKTIANAEFSQRNYFLISDPQYRKSYFVFIGQLPDQLGHLQQVVGDDPVQKAQIGPLRELLAQREKSLTGHIDLFERDGIAAVSAAVAAGHEMADQQTLTRHIDSMDGLEKQRIADLDRLAVRSRNFTMVALLTTLVVAATTLVLLFLSILRDLKARAKVGAELRIAQAQALRATQAKSEFLATMSHEIRTPMNGVIGMLDLLEQSSLQNQQIEMVRLTRESADSLLNIIEDILDFSKIEAGRMEFERVPLSLAATVERACSVLDRLAERQNTELSVYCDPAIPQTLLGDPTRIRQVLVNLVNNAIKFSGNLDRPGKVSVRATLLAQTDGHAEVEFRVADNGIGMDEATQSRLFVSFMQADVSTTRRFGGTGLGLAISNQLVELMGGSMLVWSAPDAGATFTVRLRFAVPAGMDLSGDSRGELNGVECVVVGAQGGVALDVAAYLSAEGARVKQREDFPPADARIQPAADRATVWVVESDDLSGPVAEMLARAESAAGSGAGIVMVVTGRQRRIAEATAARRIVINGNALTRAVLVKAVKVAAGFVVDTNAAAPSRRLGRTAPSRDEAIRRRQLILVAEDNRTNQKVVLQQLRLLGYAADIASNGAAALQMWHSGDYSLLFTDLHMPDMDGYDLALAIRMNERRTMRIPIVALTANALPGEGDRCREAGMDGYLTKPATLAVLEETLQKWLPHGRQTLGPELKSRAIDLRVLMSLVGDDPATISIMLEEFATGCDELGAEIERACEQRQPTLAAEAAHKLKSSARSVGALQLGHVCEQIETSGRAGNVVALQALLIEFRNTLTAVQTALTERVHS